MADRPPSTLHNSSSPAGDLLAEQIVRFLADELSAEEVRQLNDALGASPAARDLFVEMCLLESHLVEKFAPAGRDFAAGSVRDGTGGTLHDSDTMILPALRPGDGPDEPEPLDAPPLPPDWRVAHARAAWFRQRLYVGIAAVLLLGLGLAFKFLSPDRPGPVARLTSTHDAQWAPSSVLNTGEQVEPQRILRLQSGVAELTFDSGARVVIEGPAEFVTLDRNRGSLSSGRLVAHVPKRAKGFTVESPGPAVTDLGTEFGMSVGTAGTTEVHVFTGQVDVALAPPPETPAGAARQTVRLVQDEAILCPPAGGTPQRMAAAPTEFIQTTTASAASPNAMAQDVLTGLGKRLTCDGTLADAIGASPGQFVGGPPEYVPGRKNTQALRLIGNEQQHVVLPYDSRDDAITVSIWVRPTSAANQNIIVMSDQSGPRKSYSNQIRMEDGRFAFYAWDGQAHLVTGTTRVVPGNWYLITGTAVSGGKLRLYVNDAAEGDAVDIAGRLQEGDRYLVGAKSDGGTPGMVVVDAFAGSVADIRLYRRALDPHEVSTLFIVSSGKSGSDGNSR